ncbi:MAG: ArsA-related P-loop ATPase [Roseiflexaceae bacterium]
MPQTIIFSGSPGSGISIAAAAAALGLATHQKTLLLSLGSAAGLSALLGSELGPQPTHVINGLDVLVPDPSAELAAAWESLRDKLPNQSARLAADELPLLPGSPALFGLLRLPELRKQYQRVVVDAGPAEALLLALGLPDTFRWLVRLLLGLDRGPGQNRNSVLNALLPSGFLPPDFVNGFQDTRVTLEQARTQLISPEVACACFVLRPDSAAVAEARLAVPAIQMHGLAVASLAIGPLDQSGNIPDSAAALWPTRPWIAFPQPSIESLAGLAGIAPALTSCDPEDPIDAPIRDQHNGAPALVVDLPGLPKGALGLTLSSDELIIRLGPYRRHILLPPALRGSSGIRATREGDLLIIRRREG